MMSAVRHDRAQAKINLTLTIHGRRPDGFHALSSVVAFAAVGDELSLTPGLELAVTTRGPFADAIEGPNLAATALDVARTAEPRLRLGRIDIVKNLPVAAGIGGGSADAAAVLRLVRAANPDLAGSVDWLALATRLGADVPVCFENRPALMTGIGDHVVPLRAFPRLPVVLVNPRVPVPADKTRQVFRALAAPPLSATLEMPPPIFASTDDVIAHVAAGGNDLEAPSRAVMPAVAEVLARLAAEPASVAVRLSGAGPTAFALFREQHQAERAAARIMRDHPSWWVVATELGEA
jgi:4-diphosphocytidyl-2-C-methyl-D-erythritol kinase